MDRFNSGQVRQDEIGTMNGVWSDARACYSYLWGFIHGSAIHKGGDLSDVICFPQGLSGDQLGAVFLKWADGNPNKWNFDPFTAVGLAFEEAWPCVATTK
jgi:Rap1a immunity proteins